MLRSSQISHEKALEGTSDDLWDLVSNDRKEDSCLEENNNLTIDVTIVEHLLFCGGMGWIVVAQSNVPLLLDFWVQLEQVPHQLLAMFIRFAVLHFLTSQPPRNELHQ